jgi:hypothetical protein
MAQTVQPVTALVLLTLCAIGVALCLAGCTQRDSPYRAEPDADTTADGGQVLVFRFAAEINPRPPASMKSSFTFLYFQPDSAPQSLAASDLLANGKYFQTLDRAVAYAAQTYPRASLEYNAVGLLDDPAEQFSNFPPAMRATSSAVEHAAPDVIADMEAWDEFRRRADGVYGVASLRGGVGGFVWMFGYPSRGESEFDVLRGGYYVPDLRVDYVAECDLGIHHAWSGPIFE